MDEQLLRTLQVDWGLVQAYKQLDPDRDYHKQANLRQALGDHRRAGSIKTADIDAWISEVERLYQGISDTTRTAEEREMIMAEIRTLYEPDKHSYHSSPRSTHSKTKRRFSWDERGYRIKGELPPSGTDPKITETESPTGSSSLEESLARAKRAGDQTAIAAFTELIKKRDHWYERGHENRPA